MSSSSSIRQAAVVENHLKTAGESMECQNKITVTDKISDSCHEAFQALKIRRKHRYILFRLGEEAVEVDRLGERAATYEDLKSLLPFTGEWALQIICLLMLTVSYPFSYGRVSLLHLRPGLHNSGWQTSLEAVVCELVP